MLHTKGSWYFFENLVFLSYFFWKGKQQNEQQKRGTIPVMSLNFCLRGGKDSLDNNRVLVTNAFGRAERIIDGTP
jgi:hypothetical protein